MIEIRRLVESDWPQVLAIVLEVVRAADTYPYDPDMTPEQARTVWLEPAPARIVVAVDGGQIVGTAKMGPNRAGPGAHVATASFMVAGRARGRGVGTALCQDTIDWARAAGYAGIQFNAVAESNEAAVAVYLREGFQLIGTVPGAFRHPTLGRVGLHIMYKPLDEDDG